ncbi:MAG: protein translocase subunit SecF [Ktedonobacteraceae bacterium]|nr:protein translocase subunit SecF [Ktedonobacteraceae bacterium]MBO0792117.1 protein translocase subunit SecF [Ktedonobacteraceae bacterium]
MLNLVKYRYVFLGISLLVIIPGVISLFLFGLRVGIDFAGGTNATIRPQYQMSQAQINNLLKPFNLPDLQVIAGSDTTVAANKTVWVRLNTQVDSNVQNEIKKRVTQKYPEATVDYATIPGVSGGKPFTLVTLSKFKDAPKADDIKTLLKDLPKTSDPTKNTTSSTGPVPAPATATAQATGTAAATATATPQATSTASPTPTATATPNPANPANIAVSVADVQQGQTTQTYQILTSSHDFLGSANSSKFLDIQSSFLGNKGPYFQVLSSSTMGATVAADTTRMAFLAVMAASFFILLYIWFAFHKVPKAWRYGVCAILALLHDVLVVVGIFSILGHFLGIQIDALFITALLTVIGFSVHDTIVVFDRIRENLQRRMNETFSEVVNASLVQTMARSLNTSLTVLFTLLALTIFTTPGTSIHNFTLTLLIGIFSGTFSSIFNASMILVIWENGELRLPFFRRASEGRVSSKRETRRELARTR